MLFAMVMEINVMGEDHGLTSLLVRSSFRPSPRVIQLYPRGIREFLYTTLHLIN